MNISPDLVDQIVRDVMRELRACDTPSMVAAASEKNHHGIARPSTTEQATTRDSQHVITLTEKVVSEDVLAAAGAAGRSITLLPSAVVTPSGRDFIRRNQVRLQNTAINSETMTESGLLITIGESSSAQTAAKTAGWKVFSAGNEFSAADTALKVAVKQSVICSGGEPSIVCCLLNRQPSVRAAVVTKNTNLTALGNSMNPHVLCIESTSWSVVDILRVIRSLKRLPGTPANWQEINSTVAGEPR